MEKHQVACISSQLYSEQLPSFGLIYITLVWDSMYTHTTVCISNVYKTNGTLYNIKDVTIVTVASRVLVYGREGQWRREYI